MNSCNKYKYSKSQKKTKNKKPRKFKWTMYISKFKSKTCTFNTFFAETSMWLAWFYRSLRLCSHFMDKFYSKIIMLCSDLSTQPAECSRMKCPHLIEETPKQCRNMQHDINCRRRDINNVKDDQNGKKITVIGHF